MSVITDHTALASLNTRSDFDTERLTRMAAEIMGEDIIFVHRPGKSLDLGDLMSRAEFEPDPNEREKTMMDLAKWRQRLEKEGILPPCKGSRQPKEDDMVGESVNNANLPRWALSQAQRALEGEPEA